MRPEENMWEEEHIQSARVSDWSTKNNKICKLLLWIVHWVLIEFTWSMLSSGGACNIKELARWRFTLVFLILYYSMYSYFKLAFILVQFSVLFVPLYYCLALFLVNKVVLFQLVGRIIKIFHLIFTFYFGLFQSREKKIVKTLVIFK